jgi:hypothetical protein
MVLTSNKNYTHEKNMVTDWESAFICFRFLWLAGNKNAISGI